MPTDLKAHLWWGADVPEGKRHSRVFGYVRAVEERQSAIRERQIRNAYLYSGELPGGAQVVWKTWPKRDWDAPTENVIESAVDTAASMVASNRPRITFQTDGAEWSLRRRAIWLERFVEGELVRTGFGDEMTKVFRDACVFGLGALKIYMDGEAAGCERVLPTELVADEEECYAGPPRQIHQFRFVDRDVLRAQFPKKADAIARAGKGRRTNWTPYLTAESYQVVVLESWRLPTSKGAGDGRHAICIENDDLLDEPYERTKLPFVFFRWSDRLTGFYGRGLADQIAWIQARINRQNRFIARCQDLIAVPRVFMQKNDQRLALKLSNEIGQIGFFERTPPVFMTPPAVSQEVYADNDRKFSRAYQIAGISDMHARQVKPPGLQSGAALLAWNDQGSQRFSIQHQKLEQCYVDGAKHLVELYSLSDGSKKYATTWRNRSLRKRIPWSEVDIDEDLYSMSVEAASILSRTPAGREEIAERLFQKGLIPQQWALRLTGHPDFERPVALYDAYLDDVEATIEDLLDEKYQPPEPYQALDLGLAMVQLAYLKARRDGAPESVLSGMRDWMAEADRLGKTAAAPQAAQQPIPTPGAAAPEGPPIVMQAPTPQVPPLLAA